MDYPSDFLAVIGRTLSFEGGYVDDPDDPGGATNFGISQRSYPDLDIKHLTRDQAIAIYYRDRWPKYSQIRSEVRGKLFDLGVNAGDREAAIILQRACRSITANLFPHEDGVIGPQTLNTVNSYSNPEALVCAIRSEAAGHYRVLVAEKSSRAKYVDGWLRRAYS